MLICCYNRDLALVQKHKLEAEVREAVGRSQLLDGLFFEVGVGADRLLHRDLAPVQSHKLEAEVNESVG